MIMHENKSLNRKNHKIVESMKRYFSAIDNNLYAAEQVCHIHMKEGEDCEGCNFSRESTMFSIVRIRSCSLPLLRELIGEHFTQDDPGEHAGANPCYWAGASGGALGMICLFSGRKGCHEMVMVGEIRTCGRKMK